MYVFVNNWTHQVSKFMAIYNLCMCKNKIYKRKKNLVILSDTKVTCRKGNMPTAKTKGGD